MNFSIQFFVLLFKNPKEQHMGVQRVQLCVITFVVVESLMC
jgi:hypothetical protein